MLALILSVAVSTATPPCSWNDPGAHRYTGDPVVALDDYALDPIIKARLVQRMKLHTYDEVVEITRDDIKGSKGSYQNLHDMHYGTNKTCRGGVDRSQWTNQAKQPALVYCDDVICVVVPSVCGNVALVDKKPQDNEPIDISPAAGPGGGGAVGTPPSTEDITVTDTSTDITTLPPTVVVPSDTSSSDTGGGGSGVSFFPPGGESGGGGEILVPPKSPPVIPPIIPPVPEPSTWLLISIAALMFRLKSRQC